MTDGRPDIHRCPGSRLGRSAVAIWLLGVVLTLSLATPFLTRTAAAKPLQSSIVIDVATGTVLSANNPDGVTQPASLTKMMTMYLLFDALQQGKLRLTDTITFSDYAASRPSTNLAVDPGDRITVETAILAMVVRSANDVAAAVGERLAGSESAFAVKMTAKARQLGMSNTSFRNASGLPDDGNRTTARDMATLGIALLRDFPKYYPYFSRYSFTYHGVNYTGHNNLVRSFRGADGIKTGYVRASGFNLVTSAEQNGRRLVGVVLGGNSPGVRDRHMAALLQTAFLQQPGTLNTLIAQALQKDGAAKVAGMAGTMARSMTAAVANALAEPANALEGDNSADDDTDGATKTAMKSNGTKDMAAVNTVQRNIGEGDTEELQPVLKPGTQLASLETSAATVALPGSRIIETKKPKQASVDDQTTTNIWKTGGSGYGIQVGAYGQYQGAQRAATHAAQALPDLLSDARIVIDPQRNGSNTIYRARVFGLSRSDAENACKQLTDCLVIKGGENSGLAMGTN